MITCIEPEPGGEDQGILRVEVSCPFSPRELSSLRNWFFLEGWSIEAEQIDAYFDTGRFDTDL